MITLKHGCDLTDVLATCRFALLVRSSQWNRKIQCRSSCRQMLNLFELFGAAFLFIWWHLFFSTTLLHMTTSTNWVKIRDVEAVISSTASIPIASAFTNKKRENDCWP